MADPAVGSVRLVSGDSTTDVSAPTVVGRDPSRDGYTAVPLADPQRSTSRNHATLVPHGDLVEVTDLGSTNGTALTIDGVEVALVPMEPTLVTLPAELSFGDVEARLEH